jgi:uncharacterized damage-inducible protein DinB
MPQQTMTERQMYAQGFEREYQTTLKLLRAFPADKSELKPADKLKNARELAWMLAMTQAVPGAVLEGRLDPKGLPPAPATWAEVLAGVEAAHREAAKKIDTLTEDQFNAMMKLPVGPGQVADVRVGDALWMFLMDSVHHRGQFSVYMRIAGARVPSIYGPSADEPWF